MCFAKNKTRRSKKLMQSEIKLNCTCKKFQNANTLKNQKSIKKSTNR